MHRSPVLEFSESDVGRPTSEALSMRTRPLCAVQSFMYRVQGQRKPDWVVLRRCCPKHNFAGSEELCPHLRAVAKPHLQSSWSGLFRTFQLKLISASAGSSDERVRNRWNRCRGDDRRLGYVLHKCTSYKEPQEHRCLAKPLCSIQVWLRAIVGRSDEYESLGCAAACCVSKGFILTRPLCRGLGPSQLPPRTKSRALVTCLV